MIKHPSKEYKKNSFTRKNWKGEIKMGLVGNNQACFFIRVIERNVKDKLFCNTGKFT